MAVRPPRSLFPDVRAGNPAAALEYELAQERAANLGRLGRRLEAALAELSRFDASAADESEQQRRTMRHALVAEAGVALWHFVVQRDAIGLRDSPQLMRDYRVPPEVRNAMGAFPQKG
ncbi:MAG: hypothetical protein QOD74_2862 [Variibacter sp.]|jgi:hypothetical protein|nr:hypothetical protein [Variibacter sp.]